MPIFIIIIIKKSNFLYNLIFLDYSSTDIESFDSNDEEYNSKRKKIIFDILELN